jgi:uncharacterized protein (TIGR02268 family)
VETRPVGGATRVGLRPAVEPLAAPPSGRCQALPLPPQSPQNPRPTVVLTAESTKQTPGVCVTPDEPTTFVFGALLPPGAVVLSDNGSISFAQVDNFVTVYPKRSLLAGERVKLTVRFADGAAPESASFWLVGHSALGARRVEVFRHSRPADELKREAAEARAEAHQCQEDKARLLAERTEPGGLMGAPHGWSAPATFNGEKFTPC